jgi:hypothetical protein
MMGDGGKRRLDESFSREGLKKSLTGSTGTRPAVENLKISPSGQVQRKPADAPPPTSPPSGAQNIKGK